MRNFSGTSSEPESRSCPSAPSTLRRRSYSNRFALSVTCAWRRAQLLDVLVDAVVVELAEIAQHRVDLLRVDLLALQHATQLLGLARPALDLAAELADVLGVHAATAGTAVAVAAASERRLAEASSRRRSRPVVGLPFGFTPALTLLTLLALLTALPC